MLYLKNSYDEYLLGLTSSNFIEKYLSLTLLMIASVYLMLIIQLIVHEAGHCIFGLLSGYRLISFRIHSFTILKEKGKYRIMKYSCPGTAGQCLMLPPDISDKKTRYDLYLMGGVIMNFIIAIIVLFVALSPLVFPFTARILLLLNFFYGMGLAVVNGFPNTKGRINNDGTNYLYLKRDEKASKSNYLQLSYIPRMIQGSTYKEFPEESFQLSTGADLTNAIFGWHRILESYYYMDLRLWDRAKECIDGFEPIFHKVSKMQRQVILLERLFINIFIDSNPSEIDDLYTKTKKLLYHTKADFHISRVRMAYEIYIDNSEKNKERIRKELDNKMINYAYKGEATFCECLIRELLENDKDGL